LFTCGKNILDASDLACQMDLRRGHFVGIPKLNVSLTASLSREQFKYFLLVACCIADLEEVSFWYLDHWENTVSDVSILS
jgi:hypothetical protein